MALKGLVNPQIAMADLTAAMGLGLTVGPPSTTSSTSPRQRGAHTLHPTPAGGGVVSTVENGNGAQGSESTGLFANPKRGVCRMGRGSRCGPSPHPPPGLTLLAVVALLPAGP